MSDVNGSIDSEPAPKRPNCSECAHKGSIAGDAHIRCSNYSARVSGSLHGIKSGWFVWPFNFDPVWLISCNGFKPKES